MYFPSGNSGVIVISSFFFFCISLITSYLVGILFLSIAFDITSYIISGWRYISWAYCDSRLFIPTGKSPMVPLIVPLVFLSIFFVWIKAKIEKNHLNVSVKEFLDRCRELKKWHSLIKIVCSVVNPVEAHIAGSVIVNEAIIVFIR